MADRLVVTCFKWFDPSYRWNKLYLHDALHVNRLRAAVARNLKMPHEFVCITDDAEGIDDDIRIVPLWDDHAHMGMNYRRLKMYSSEMKDLIGPRFINFDLDIVVCGPLDPLLERTEPFVAWKDVFYKRQAFNGSMVMMDAGSQSKVWDTFDPKLAVTLWKTGKGIGSDQAWAYHVLGRNVAMWTTSDGVYSFQYDLVKKKLQLPDNAAVVIFHGACGPAMTNLQKQHPWILEHWR